MNSEPTNAKTTEILPPSIPDQEILRCIGQGSYGEVWLSRSVTGAYRSIKVVRREKFDHAGPFEREFRGLQNFEKVSLTHPGLVALLHVGRNQSAGYFYYVMELADDVNSGQGIDPEKYEAKTLRREMAKRGKLPVGECVEIGLTLAASLAHLQGHRLIHRDVKPSNIIFVNGAAKLADIGLVSPIGQSATGACTPSYAPPEGPGGATTDTYGLGRVLYEISTGLRQEYFPELPTEMMEGAEAGNLLQLNKIVTRACAFTPGERYQTAEAMQMDLARLHRQIRSGHESGGRAGTVPQATLRVYLDFKSNVQPDMDLVHFLQDRLPQRGIEVCSEPGATPGLEWVYQMEREIERSNAVIVVLSAESAASEMVVYAIEVAVEAARHHEGRPRLIPIRIGEPVPLPAAVAKWLDPLPNLQWGGPAGNDKLLADLVHQLQTHTPMETEIISRPEAVVSDATGGAVALDSKFYVERAADAELKQAIGRGDSIVLVKGARQIGKTSLLARGLQYARNSGARVVMTDFQKLDASHLASAESLYLGLGDSLADQLDLAVLPEEAWDPRRSPNTNFERYLRREVLGRIAGHFVWGLDEVDRLFACDFGSGVFGLLRSWHNERALDPSGPWTRMTLAIAYATEAHLFITDVNQSPFNVGTRLVLEDFSLEQVKDLNLRHGSPLRSQAELEALFGLLGGHPYLTRHALNQLASGRTTLDAFVRQADGEEGIFGDHLRRMVVLLAKDPGLCDVVRAVLRGQPCRDRRNLYRLRSAGLLKGDAGEQAVPRCELYTRYLKRHLL